MTKSTKIIVVIMIIIIALCLSACDTYDNHSYDTNYIYNKAHIRVNDVWFDVDIDKWREFSDEQMVLILTDGTEIMIHSRDCILYSGTLPTAEKH